MMLAPAAMADAATSRNPIGTGPYVHNKAESREGEVQVYTPNPTYWDKDKIGLARYEVWEMPDDTARLNALKTGQIDAGNWLANPQARDCATTIAGAPISSSSASSEAT